MHIKPIFHHTSIIQTKKEKKKKKKKEKKLTYLKKAQEISWKIEQKEYMAKGKKKLPSLGNETDGVDSHFDYFSDDENEEGIMKEYAATEAVQLSIVQSMLQPRKAANMGQSSDRSDFVPKGSHKNKKKPFLMDTTQAKMITPSNKIIKNNDSAPHSSHKGRMVEINRADFEEFALKPTEEDHSSPDDDYLFLSDSLKAAIRDENTCFEPIETQVLEEIIQKKELRRVFGNQYLEGQSNPRLFAVRLHQDKTTQEPGYIVFKVTNPEGQEVNKAIHPDDNGDVHVDKLVSIRLTLECNLPNEERCRIRKKLADHIYCDDSTKTIQQLVAYIEEQLADDDSSHKACTMRDCVKSKQASSSTTLFSYLAHFNKWNVDSFDKHDALRIVQEEQLVHIKNVASSSARNTDNLVCDVCLDTCGHMNGSAMLSCGHWFCNNCWSYDLVSRVMRGDQQLLCPGYKCNTIIDIVTLLSVLPYSYYIKYQYFSSNAKLERSSIWKWCQGKEGECRKIIRGIAASTDAEGSADGNLEERICISCPCKTNWCFDCGKEPHWPATCKQAVLYTEYIRMVGDKKTQKTVTLPLVFTVDVTTAGTAWKF